MSNLSRRIKRVHDRTHTFVTPDDLALQVDYWNRVFAQADVDIERARRERHGLIERFITPDGVLEDREIHDFMVANPYVYYLTMRDHAIFLQKIYPKGLWVSNDDEEVLDALRTVKIRMSKTQLR